MGIWRQMWFQHGVKWNQEMAGKHLKWSSLYAERVSVLKVEERVSFPRKAIMEISDHLESEKQWRDCLRVLCKDTSGCGASAPVGTAADNLWLHRWLRAVSRLSVWHKDGCSLSPCPVPSPCPGQLVAAGIWRGGGWACGGLRKWGLGPQGTWSGGKGATGGQTDPKPPFFSRNHSMFRRRVFFNHIQIWSAWLCSSVVLRLTVRTNFGNGGRRERRKRQGK